ncbi:MAG: hypothetical protein QM401_04940, partial [Bacillota bacterium]|nr:hypothetical protein [Bacillota bacterium]
DMAGTITFNRARGTHLLEPMENIVQELLEEGLTVDEISKKLGVRKKEFQITNWHTGYENTERKIWSHQSVDG